jgi:hypothetical protein
MAALEKPFHKKPDQRRAGTRCELEPARRHRTARRRLHDPLVTPQLHRQHGRLFQETPSRLQLQEGEIAPVDRQQAEQQ